MSDNDFEIKTRACPLCSLCGAQGKELYGGMGDRLFDAPGVWNIKKCLNSACGLLWLDPMPVEEDIDKAYNNYYTHQSDLPDRKPGLFTLMYRAARKGYWAFRFGYPDTGLCRLLVPLIYLYPGARMHANYTIAFQRAPESVGRLLEVGFGSDSMLKQMSSLGWDAQGIDVNPVAVENARKRGLKVSLGNLQSQSFPESCFDVIVLIHVVEHVHLPLELLRECYRVLRSGGEMIIATPNAASLGHRLFRDAWLHLDPPRHLHLFNGQNMKKIAEASGLRVKLLKTTRRGAASTSKGSWQIRKHGHISFDRMPMLSERIGMFLYYCYESFLTKLSRAESEDLLLIATKGE